MVKEVRENGRRRLSQLGGYDWHSIGGAEVQVHRQQGSALSGTVVNIRQSTHVWGTALTATAALLLQYIADQE